MGYRKEKVYLLIPLFLTTLLMVLFSYNFYKLRLEWNSFFQIAVKNEADRVKSLVESTVGGGGDPIESLSSYVENSRLLKGIKVEFEGREIIVPGSDFSGDLEKKQISSPPFKLYLFFDTSYRKEINRHILFQFLAGLVINILLLLGIAFSLRLYFYQKLSFDREKHEKERLKSVSIAISSILHEVKNALSRLNMLAYRVSRESSSKYAELMQNEVQKLGLFIEEASRINKPIVLNRKKVSLKKLLFDVVSEFSDVAQAEGVKINVNVSADIPVFIDRDKFLIVLRNLIKNAIEAVAGKEGNRVVEIAAEKDGNLVRIYIKDSGGSLPDEIFKPFKTTKEGGFGLGLYNSRRIVKAHGGRLEAYVKDGWTVMLIEIPLE
ncbi:sensor histidine kinase [Desulfurobacterium sp.]